MWKRDVTFTATGEDGRTYYVHQETDTTTEQHFEGVVTSRGATRLVTSTGAPVERLGPGEYWVRSIDRVLWSSDPHAP